MSVGTLYISFWKICLENLPEGRFSHRRISAEDAKRLIKQAQKEKRLLCASEADLLASYRERECERHESFCKVLKKHFGIALTLKDFTMRFEDEKGPGFCINPLNCFQIRGKDQLLIVSCSFGMRDKTIKDRLVFKIEPRSVT